MDYSFIIRKALTSDAEAIVVIMQEAFHKYIEDTGLKDSTIMDALSETPEDIRRDIDTKEVYIAIMDDIPVGSVRVAVRSGETAYISRFGVRLDFHNIGIGKALINLVDKVLISKGIKKAYLHTASKYNDLVRFYYGRGFYIESTSNDRGYIRALMVKEYS